MRLIDKTVSLVLTVVVVVTCLTSIAFSANAISIVPDDEYDYMVYSNKSYMLYKYNGNDTDIVLPDSFLGKPVVGIWDNCFKDSGIKSIEIPDSYINIGSDAFYSCANLQSVRFPASLTSLGIGAFSFCTSLEEMDFSAAVSIKEIPYALCNGDTMLKTVNIPGNINTIGERAFSGTGLTSVNIPDSVNEIYEYAFYGCVDLEEVTLPEKLTVLRRYIFSGCTSLESIVLPSDLKVIEDYAFKNATSLESVEIPRYLTKIGVEAFMNDTSLTKLFIPYSVTSIGANAFAPMSYNETLEVTCYENSYAAEYCYENTVNYKTIGIMFGDANDDGKINILDATAIQYYKIGERQLTDYGISCADVNHDGKISIRDATLIQMYLAKIITEF